MTTSPPALSVPTTEVCRITVEGPSGRADLALPVSTALAALLPVLLRHVVPGPERNGAPWVLQRLGEDPLDLDGTPDTLGLRHGDVLYLRPADEPLAGLHFDDISDGVAHVIDKQTDRWRPELTRRLAIVLTALAFVALGVTVYGSGPGTLATVACGVIALVLGAGCVVASRMGASASSVRTAGVGALLFAGLAGLAPFHGAHEHFTLGQHGLLLAAGTVALVSGVLLLLNVLPFAVPGTFLLTAVVTAVTAAVMSLGQSAQHAVALVGVGMFVLGLFGPRLTLRAARLRVPQLPRNAEELQQGIEPEEEETVTRRVRIANSYLNTLSISSALVYAVTFLMLVRDNRLDRLAAPAGVRRRCPAAGPQLDRRVPTHPHGGRRGLRPRSRRDRLARAGRRHGRVLSHWVCSCVPRDCCWLPRGGCRPAGCCPCGAISGTSWRR